MAAFGGPVPVINDGNGAHFQNQVMSDGRRVTMAREGDGTARGFTTLDFAALDDIGWELRPAAQVPGPTTPPGSAAPFTAITGISGIQVVAKPAGFEVRDTSRVVFNGRLYRGYTDADENVHIEVSPDTTPNFGNSRDTGQQARGNPSLTVNNGKLFIAWTGTNSDQNLNVAQVNVDSNGIFTGLTTGTHEVLGYTSDHAPGIGAHREALVLAHSGQPVDISGDEKLYLDVRAERGSKTSWGPGAFDTGQLTEHPPVLTVFDNGASNEIYLYWIGTDGGDNYARVDFASASFTPPQSFGVGGRSLTVDGDQPALGFDDDITIERTAAGGIKVTLNGEVAEYGPNALDNVVVNTGGGNNTIRVLSILPGVVITINGAGTDRLTFGPGQPAPVFTPDANGLPGFGTLNVGGALIHLKGLEFVDGVTPDVTGVQLTSVTIDENGVATVTGTFADPGSYSTHSMGINWGDGTSDPAARLILGERSFTATHRYLDDNPTGTPFDIYSITASVTDNDNLADSGTSSVTVKNVAPQLQSVRSDSGNRREWSGHAQRRHR